MSSFDNVSSTVEEIKDLFSRRRRDFEGKTFVLVDPVSRDGDRCDVSIACERTDLTDYEVLRNGRNPNASWPLDCSMIWERRTGKPYPVGTVRSFCVLGLGFSRL